MKYVSPNEIFDLIKNNRIIVYRNNYVYDITNLINKHPGGNNCLLKKLGTNCHKDYEYHRDHAKKIWEKYLIGSNIPIQTKIFEDIINYLKNKL